MLREARTRYGRQRFGYLWALIEPILHIAFFYVFWSLTLRVVPLGHSLALFLATGLATYCGFANVLSRTQGGFASNEALLAYPIVTVADVFLARALLELSTWVAVSFIILTSLVVFAGDPLPNSVPTIILALLLLFGIALGVGTVIGIVSQFYPSVDNLLTIPLKLLYFTSGVFYLPEALPPAARDFLAWNPVLHGITLFRMGYYGNYDSHLLSFGYLVGWSIVAVFCAFLIERTLRKALLSRNY
jgi:capsular polysaccharide transport system permease protein